MRGARRFVVLLVSPVACALLLGACGATSSTSASSSASRETGGATATTPTRAQVAAEANGASLADTDPSGIEWLCRPGQAADPCLSDMTDTVVEKDGSVKVQRSTPPSNPPIDCFYVYPTVSGQSGINANLHIDPAEVSVAKAQASRFSAACRVYAPVYPQLTLNAIANPAQVTTADLAAAYSVVAASWEDYLSHYNHGRGVVVIGHSQGAAMLIALLNNQVDDEPSVRSHLVSAIILGGNVTVPIGKTVGGSFKHIPACRSETQTRCVVAYSSFDQQPPADSLFGRPGGVSEMFTHSNAPTSDLQVLCVNPASPKGGTAVLSPYFPSRKVVSGLVSDAAQAPQVSTPWVSEPDLYSARCEYSDGASWLQVSAPIDPGDTRAVVQETLGPTWGLHLVDVNIALGNLVDLVKSQAAAYTR